MNPVTDPVAHTLMRELQGSAAEQFAVADRMPGRFVRVWSDNRPPAEFCDCTTSSGTGMAWVRLVSQDPSRLASGGMGPNCASGLWSVVVELGVYRCDQTTLDERGTPPSEDIVSAQHDLLAVDAAVLRRSVRCSRWLDRNTLSWSVERLVPLGPTGGCVGAALTVRVETEDACGCPEGSQG